MKSIAKDELIKLIDGISGTTFVGIDMVSEARMRKTNNPYVGAVKRTALSGQINYDYENAVNKQLQREGKGDIVPVFEAQPRKWGVRQGNWIEHKGEHYLSLKVLGNPSSVFEFEGKQINEELLKDYMVESHKPHTQAELDKEIVVRDIKLSNIRGIRILGEEYEVI